MKDEMTTNKDVMTQFTNGAILSMEGDGPNKIYKAVAYKEHTGLNRNGYRVDMSAFDNLKKNLEDMPLFANHGWFGETAEWAFPIGKVVNAYVEPGIGLMNDFIFTDTPQALFIKKLVDAQIAKQVSIGLMRKGDKIENDEPIVTSADQLELSIVGIGAVAESKIISQLTDTEKVMLNKLIADEQKVESKPVEAEEGLGHQAKLLKLIELYQKGKQ